MSPRWRARPTMSCGSSPTSCASARRSGESLDALLPETFALVREAGRRTMGMRHFDVQLIGGMVLHDGAIAEMSTGEGKTLTATTAVVLNALAGRGVHLVTVNDYLARRDALWMKPIYDMLGMSVGILQTMQSYEDKQLAYACDITYGTNSEFGFDYLRDNMATTLEEKVQHGGRPKPEAGLALPPLRDRRRGRQHPDRRGPYAADHLRRARAGRRPLREVRQAGAADGARQDARRHADPREKKELRRRLRLRDRREVRDRLGHRAGRRQGRALPGHRPPVPRRERPPGQPPAPVAEGRGAEEARRRLRRDRRRGPDHRRAHRPHPRRAPLVRGPAPGRRGQGGRAASRRRTRRSRRSRSRTTSASTTSSPA